MEALLATEENARDDVQAAVRSGLDALAFPLVGETISHYRILEGLGGGGMGLVYRAEDVKLGRQVALKFLPEESRKDPVALSRFEREARSASLIEHPNICPIYEFGEYEGQPFLVMQLLQGQTLRELLSATSPAKSPLGLDQLLDLALQITRGLEAAHSHGIIHRDIKPANIFVTKQGQAKILDFGLAKLSHGGVADEEERQLPRDAAGRNGAKENAEAPAPPDPFLSRTGVAMGTAGYMSPEQERGEKLDARTDLFSFGLVLNEMTAALRASKGDQGLHPAIRKSQRQFNPLLPSKLEAVIGKTLERDRDLRYQSALELRADLQAVQELLTPSKGLRSSKHKSAKSVWVTCGTAALVLLSALVLSRHIRKTPNSQLASVEVVPLIAIEGKQGWPLFSPDGKRIAFAQFEGPHPGIYTTLVGGEKPLQLTENLRDCCPAWSPDGRQIVFVRYEPGIGRSFYVVPALGGSERRLYTGPLNGRPSCDKLDWSPEGKALMFTEPTNGGFGSRITLLSLSDFTTKPLTSPQNHVFDCEAVFSPDGRSLAFVRGFAGGGNGDLFLLGVSGGEPRQLTFGNSAGTFAWTPDGGEIVFSSVMGGLQNLWRVSSSGGTPRPVEGIGGPASRPSISSKGEQLVFQQSTQNDNVWRIDLKDEKHALGPPVLAFSSRGYIRRPSFSPDGKKVAFESDRLGYSDIWICESEGSNCAQVTSLHTSGTARWSPDGRHLVFESDYQGLWQVYVVQVPGGEPQLFRTFPETDNGAPNWSVDGKWIYFYSGHQHTTLELWKIPFNGGAPIEVTRNGGVYATESEDGSSLYYAKFGKQGIWRMPLNGGEETHILDQPMSWYDWALTPTGIYFINNGVQPEGPAAFIKHVNGRIEFFDFANREITPIHNLEKPASEFGGLAISPDGKYLLYGQTDADDSYNMLVKNFR